MECPKDKEVSLVEAMLQGGLPVLQCPDCKGSWITRADYARWQTKQPPETLEANPKLLDVEFERSPLDTQAALCPACHHYLSRTKVGHRHSFYVERCSNCEGIWCDRGEWDALTQMGLQASIDQIFSTDWKARIKALEYRERERQATIDKLGEEIACRIFELAELLEAHPNGDFGVAYLMRRFDQS